MAIQFQDITIMIVTRYVDADGNYKKKEQQGKVGTGTGLGYHMDEHGTYNITHLASGYAIPHHPRTERQAQQFIESTHDLTNWNRSRDDLTGAPVYPTIAKEVDRRYWQVMSAVE